MWCTVARRRFFWLQEVNGAEHVVWWPKSGCQDALNTGLQLCCLACYVALLHGCVHRQTMQQHFCMSEGIINPKRKEQEHCRGKHVLGVRTSVELTHNGKQVVCHNGLHEGVQTTENPLSDE